MELFYRKTGEGSPLIIVHGLYGSSDNWMPIARQLSARHTVYMIDQRNHGHSPHHPDNSYESMKNDLAEFFEQHQLGQAIVLGHSMGGKAAMLFAADYPEKIEKLVIADIAPKDYLTMAGDSQFHLHRNILLAMQELNFSTITTRKEIEEHFAEKIDHKKINGFLLKNIEKDKKTGLFKWRLNVETLYNYLEEIVGGVNERWFEGRIPITAYPVIFIRGLNSNYILPDDEALIKRIYPDAKIIGIPNAGHWLHAEQPDLFVKAVEQYA